MNTVLIYLLVIATVITRFLPHPENFAPITAIAIFAAAYLPKKQAVALPLAARFLSDVFLGFYQWPLMLAVYASHLSGVLLGLWVRQGKGVRWARVAVAPLAASAVFFLATNFAFLYPNYPHDWSGILQSYANALPFLRGTMFGDVAYTALLFGGFEVARAAAFHRYRNLAPVR